MTKAPQVSLQQSSLFSAQAFRHYGCAQQPLLSVKSMFNGRAIYKVDGACFAVDETGYLILNEDHAYEIEIDSPTKIESFIVYFPRYWVADVFRVLSMRADELLDSPLSSDGPSLHLFERFTPHDEIVSPGLRRLRHKYKAGGISNGMLEEELRGLLASMLEAQRGLVREIENMPALRCSTRQELWRRLNRARDFIRARFETPLTLMEMAAVACLSPFHFLRAFKSAFGVSPHQFMTHCRLERSRFLLERTEMPVTEVCLAVGFDSLGTFSSWFRRHAGVSPRDWKKARSKK